MQTEEVRGAVYSRFKDITAFSKAVGWSRQKASYIVNRRIEPSLRDVQQMAHALAMEPVQVAAFFLK